MARNPVAANLIMIFGLVVGLLSMIGTRKETFPELSMDQVQIQVPYLGASPEEVEEGVCKRIEDRLVGLEGVRRVRAVAAEGMGLVTAELEPDTDMDRMLDNIQNEVNRIDTFPAETERPIVKEVIRRNRVIDVVLYGQAEEKALKAVAQRLKEELRDLDGISQVELKGVRPDEIAIEVSEEALRRHGLTLAQVAAAVQRTSLDLPAGSVKSEGGEILVRTKGMRYTGRQYEDVEVMARPDGTRLLLGQIADIRDGLADTDLISRFNGQPAAVIQVFRTGDESALEISDQVKGFIAREGPRLPVGMHLDYARDDARLLRGRLTLLLEDAAVGILLLFVCLTLFLDLRLAFWVMMDIPFSFLGSFIAMHFFGVSINMLSLFSFIVVLGIVVDDAIIIGEVVFAHRQRGKGLMQAAIDGIREVGTSVIFGVLTTVTAFIPMLFVDGLTGKFMKMLPIVVISVLFISLFEAFFILPSHLATMGQGASSRFFERYFGRLLRWHDQAQAWMDRHLMQLMNGPYTRLMRLVLDNPLSGIAAGVAILLFTLGWIAGGHIKFAFMPKIDSDWLTISVAMPQGATAEQTASVVARIEEGAMQVRDEYDQQRPGQPSLYRNVFTFIGDQPVARQMNWYAGASAGGQAHLAEITVELQPAEEREIPSPEIAARVRERVGELPGPESVNYNASLIMVGNPIEVQLFSDNFPLLLQGVERLKAELASYPGVKDIKDNFQEGKLEMKLSLKPQARALGLTLADLARQVRQGFYGEQAQRFQRGEDDVRVMVRYPEDERRSLADVERMRIRTPAGAEVPFSEVAAVSLGRGYSAIQRTDGKRVVSVTADVDEERANAEEISSDLAHRFLPALEQDYPGLRHSYEGEQRERQESLASLGRGFFIALIAIYALIAIPFRSYSQPVVVMSVIPFGMIGAVWGHVIMGMDLTMISLFGIVALSGVVVNDSIVLISCYNQLREEQGLDWDEALIEAGKQRSRAILANSVTTFLGVFPMIMEKSVQAQFLIPIAVGLGFGILFGTTISMIGVPVVMKVLELARARLGQETPVGMAPAEAR
jgi:multidrug efflux pump subunit AcrB